MAGKPFAYDELISIHAPREGSDYCRQAYFVYYPYFNPRSPRGERRRAKLKNLYANYISIHAPREGSDMRDNLLRASHKRFQSTLPARGATAPHNSYYHDEQISIHAPREGSDVPFAYKKRRSFYFNPRSPRGERLKGFCKKSLCFLFQSTLPARGATDMGIIAKKRWIDFNPRSPRGERLWELSTDSGGAIFQSTLPARGATLGVKHRQRRGDISIHAPREGSDLHLRGGRPPRGNFNPRSPRGERRFERHCAGKGKRFQSTLPARGATRRCPAGRAGIGNISIHAPREGSDVPTDVITADIAPFQSTLPARGATYPALWSCLWHRHFNPRSPRGERP